MASAEVQAALDQVLAPHLRLEPTAEEMPKYTRSKVSSFVLLQNNDASILLFFFLPKQENKNRKFLQGTLEADNKRRPGIQKQNSVRFRAPPPEPPDPNSGILVFD